MLALSNVSFLLLCFVYRHPIFGHQIVGSRKTQTMVSVEIFPISFGNYALY